MRHIKFYDWDNNLRLINVERIESVKTSLHPGGGCTIITTSEAHSTRESVENIERKINEAIA